MAKKKLEIVRKVRINGEVYLQEEVDQKLIQEFLKQRNHEILTNLGYVRESA